MAELSPEILDVGDRCAWSVAAEGSRMALGAPGHDGKGAVFIYSFNGTSWNSIIPNQVEPGDQFGYSVSLSGELLAVGAVTDDTAGTDAGAVYVLEEISSTEWAIQEKLLPSEPADQFGESVSIWDDTIAVGEWRSKRVYVFRQSSSSWTQEGDEDGPPFDSPGLTELTAIASSFGESVAVYQNTLLVGDDDYTVPGGIPNGNSIGRAYVYTRVGSTWARAEEDIVNPEAVTDAEHFGESVALHGRWAVIGAPQFDFGEVFGQGVVHTYRTDDEGVYQWQSTFTSSDGAGGDWFGTSVALRAGVLVVGAPTKTVGGVYESGAAYQFNLTGGSWTEVGAYDPADLAQFDRFGWSVAVGSNALIGAPNHVSSQTETGRALVWSCE